MQINIDKDGNRAVKLTKTESGVLRRASVLLGELSRVATADKESADDIVLAADQCKILANLYGAK